MIVESEHIATNKFREVMNEVNYHAVPDLQPEEIKALKKAAIDLGITVRELIRQAILFYLVQPQIKSLEEE